MGISFFFRKKKNKIETVENVPLGVSFNGDKQLVELLQHQMQPQRDPSHNEQSRSKRSQNKLGTVEFLSFMTQDHPGWVCKKCGARNAIATNNCEVCGFLHAYNSRHSLIEDLSVLEKF